MKTNGKYILDDNGNPKEERDLLKWAAWFGDSGEKRIVAKDTIGESKVSTVFLGLDNSFGGNVPILYETMIFGGKEDGYQERYATKEEAVAGHKKAISLVK